VNDTLKYTLKFLVAVGILVLVMRFFFDSKPKPERVRTPLDYTKQVYTTSHAVICPQSLFNDPREGHDLHAVLNMYVSPFDMDSKAEKLGCEVWHGGVAVTAMPIDETFAEINDGLFTATAHLTNNGDGSIQYADSVVAPPSNNVPPSFGHWLVTKPSSDPIPKGTVVGSAEGSGDVICPDSNAFAEYDDAALAWFAAHGSDVLKEDAPSQLNSVNEETKELAKQHGCNYLSPGTLMMSEGGNQTGSMAIVTAKMLDGTAIRGVTLPSSITQDPQRLEAAKKQAQGQDSTPSTSSPEISRQPEPPGKAVDPTLVWIDPKSGLAWTKKDNGTGVTWQAAMAYCQSLQLDGQSDWRLPTIEELQGIYDSTIQAPDPNSGGRTVPWQVRGNLLLSAWGEWSSSQGNSPGQALVFGFGNGAAFSYRFEGQKKPRALCVRSPLQPESGYAGKAPS
jgi:hypothetical protein